MALTGQIRLLARLYLFRGRFDEFLQCLVFDIVGAPFGHSELGQIATELHDDGSTASSRTSCTMMSVWFQSHRFFAFGPEHGANPDVEEKKKMSSLRVTKSDQVSGRTQGINGAMRGRGVEEVEGRKDRELEDRLYLLKWGTE